MKMGARERGGAEIQEKRIQDAKVMREKRENKNPHDTNH